MYNNSVTIKSNFDNENNNSDDYIRYIDNNIDNNYINDNNNSN